MQAQKLQQIFLRAGYAAAFMLAVSAPISIVLADNQKLEVGYNSAQDILEFLDKNTTTSSMPETKIIKLGYHDEEQELFNKESYRRKNRRKRNKQSADSKKPVAPATDFDEKVPMTINKGDYSLTFGGATKIENYFQRNMELLNRNLPDEAEYFKNTFDFTVDLAYGEKRFGHKAVEAYLDFMHKGVWGKNGSFADSEPSAPTQLQLADTFFGSHTHTNGRPFIWIRDGWLRVSLNAIADSHAQGVHYIKVGWFPFILGRGISLGYAFGLNRSLLGLYSYSEDKSPAGINLSGEIFKDSLSYDLYWSRLEERNKNLRDTTNVMRDFYTPAPQIPWRGLGKNNDVVAARLKVKPFKSERVGNLEFEPYIMYNTAPDQKIEMLADSDTNLGIYGLAVEHSYNGFEWGGEVAANFGSIQAFAIDTNKYKIVKDASGSLIEQFTKIVVRDPITRAATKTPVQASDFVAKIVKDQLNFQAYENNPAVFATVGGSDITNAPGRFRPAYKNKLAGWMGVFDGAYNFKDKNLKAALGVGYASGDVDLDANQKSGTHKGFIGLNEIYSGKRVVSIMLDERRLQRPVITSDSANPAATVVTTPEFSFTDICFGGASATWTPVALGKKWQFNPNALLFWSAFQDQKPILNVDGSAKIDPSVKMSSFLGSELNLLTKIELLKDFNMVVNLAVFLPGQFFKDVSGVKVGEKDYLSSVEGEEGSPDITQYRMASDPAFHVNIGFSYKF
jgi:hypothetical protein